MEKETSKKLKRGLTDVAMTIQIPEQYRKAMKMEAAEKNTTIRQIIIDLLTGRYGKI